MDKNGGGFVLFDEFTAYLTERKLGVKASDKFTKTTDNVIVEKDRTQSKHQTSKKIEQTHPFFRESRIDTCGSVKIINGNPVAQAFK
jgi:hypothetical protein